MNKLMIPRSKVGITGYGAYIPRLRLPTKDISLIWRGGRDLDSLPVQGVSVAGPDEDPVTMAIEATQNALYRASVDKNSIRSVYIGSESHPYLVKTTGSIVADVLDITPNTTAADFQFGSKAGSEAMQVSLGMVSSGMMEYSVCIGVDSALVKPGDELEYTAAAGAFSAIIGPANESLAILDASFSYVTDTPDFFRRENQKYPQHSNRFTGGPGYFDHIESAASMLMTEMGLNAKDFTYAVFHQPNLRYTQKLSKNLGFTQEQISQGLLCSEIGNAYSSSALLGLSSILDVASPGDKILMGCYGAGAGSDVFAFTVTENIKEKQSKAPLTESYLKRAITIDYLTYARLKGKVNQH